MNGKDAGKNTGRDIGEQQDGPGYDGSEARLGTDATHTTTPFADDKRRPAPSDYRNPNMGPGPGGHPGPSGRAPKEHPDQRRDGDVAREPLDAERLKHRPEDDDYGSGYNALAESGTDVVNISPDDHVEEAQAIHEKRVAKD